MTFGMYNVDYEQRIYNPERMRKYRLDRAHAALKKHGLGAMIVYDFDDFRYLGYCIWHNYMRRRPARYLLLIRGDGYPYCPATSQDLGEYRLMPWLRDKMVLKYGVSVQAPLCMDDEWVDGELAKQAAEMKDLLKKHRVLDEPVGIDMHFGLRTVDALRKAGIKVVDGNKAMAEARMIKNEDEIECCRTAGAITESAHWEVCKALRPGVTEWQIAGVAAKALFDLGAEELEGPSFILSSGPRFGNFGVQTGTDRVVRPGEMFVIDINGVSFQGYRTCFYRTYCVGDKPTEKQLAIYEDTYNRQWSMEKNLRPGISSLDYCKAVLEDGDGKWPGNLHWEGKNWGPRWPEPGYYGAVPSGHQLGLASGDPGPSPSGSIPRERITDDGKVVVERPAEKPFTIQKGMVLATEVGVREWDGKKWLYDAAKLENVVVVTDTGFEVLYRFPYKDLITVGLPGIY
ncbi:MAG: Xaa-Pro peptidase family protein [Candidatus Bathyarchaeota archaeon]